MKNMKKGKKMPMAGMNGKPAKVKGGNGIVNPEDKVASLKKRFPKRSSRLPSKSGNAGPGY